MNVRLSNVNNELRCALHTPAPRQRRAGIPSHSHARKARRSPASRGSSSSHPQAVPRGTHTSPVRRPPTPDLLTLALPAEPARQNQRATSVPNIYKVTLINAKQSQPYGVRAYSAKDGRLVQPSPMKLFKVEPCLVSYPITYLPWAPRHLLTGSVQNFQNMLKTGYKQNCQPKTTAFRASEISSTLYLETNTRKKKKRGNKSHLFWPMACWLMSIVKETPCFCPSRCSCVSSDFYFFQSSQAPSSGRWQQQGPLSLVNTNQTLSGSQVIRMTWGEDRHHAGGGGCFHKKTALVIINRRRQVIGRNNTFVPGCRLETVFVLSISRKERSLRVSSQSPVREDLCFKGVCFTLQQQTKHANACLPSHPAWSSTVDKKGLGSGDGSVLALAPCPWRLLEAFGDQTSRTPPLASTFRL
ncbi:uncharacterized protein UV8b_03561 [Ustilaginoidea virens]|uniref:Uncharacterized protein n=1 Tax=Ustilaginoidea virens TaxID=1159556 RepID=A0A8E5HQ47_USTVR|nr:uncharacterized protein UV8b_03561 [Ustilaginoidea virens]QUC19320.1 hypothetical protein UV8b_03561 [Ustilaginoidea virens]